MADLWMASINELQNRITGKRTFVQNPLSSMWTRTKNWQVLEKDALKKLYIVPQAEILSRMCSFENNFSMESFPTNLIQLIIKHMWIHFACDWESTTMQGCRLATRQILVPISKQRNQPLLVGPEGSQWWGPGSSTQSYARCFVKCTVTLC